jgi:hypothetical protein
LSAGTCAIDRGGFRSIRGNGGMWPIGLQSREIIAYSLALVPAALIEAWRKRVIR